MDPDTRQRLRHRPVGREQTQKVDLLFTRARAVVFVLMVIVASVLGLATCRDQQERRDSQSASEQQRAQSNIDNVDTRNSLGDFGDPEERHRPTSSN